MLRIIIVIFILIPLPLKAELQLGDFPPSYLGKNRSGDKVNLSEMKGKIVVATFWATWCPHCIKEMKVLEGIQKQVGKDKLEIVAINFKESRKTFRRVKKVLKDFKITLTHDRKGKISNKFGVKSIPHMFIIDKQGKIARIHIGYGKETLPKLINELNNLIFN